MSSLMLGIIFGGLMKGIEKEGRIQISKLPLDLFLLKFSGIGSNWLQILPLESNGSINTAFCLFLAIELKFLR